MSLLQRIFPWVGKGAPPAPALTVNEGPLMPGEIDTINSELGRRTTPENQVKYLYRQFWVDPEVRQAIVEVREMDVLDGRVKKIHGRVARDIVRGGLVLPTQNESLRREWDVFQRRLQLNFAEKLKSDARGLVMEGNLPMQWVLDPAYNVVAGVRMASETIIPQVTDAGRFRDVRDAHHQMDLTSGVIQAKFPLWQLFMARFDPLNYDDFGAMGRPYLDSSRTIWKKLTMTEEDLVIRRRVRAPLRMAHVLKGANKDELEAYRATIERDQYEITTDYYLNKEGSVTAVGGDTNLDQMADVVYLLDCFFAGAPAPKALMGFTEGMNRDILNDLKTDYYDEIDTIQETLSFVYESGFRLHLLLKGIAPDDDDVCVKFAQRRAETPNQVADRALKLRALGLSYETAWEEMGLDPGRERERVEWERENWQPYPDPAAVGASDGALKIKITPGNAPQGESATSVTNDVGDVSLAEDTLSLADINPLADIAGELHRALSQMAAGAEH